MDKQKLTEILFDYFWKENIYNLQNHNLCIKLAQYIIERMEE